MAYATYPESRSLFYSRVQQSYCPHLIFPHTRNETRLNPEWVFTASRQEELSTPTVKPPAGTRFSGLSTDSTPSPGMTTNTPTTEPFADFSDLPTEIIHLICDSCSDDDLLSLCQTSRHFRNMALPTLLAHHGTSRSDILSGTISISTHSLPIFRRTLFASPINKLTCIFDEDTAERDLSGLRRLVSRLPQIGEVEVTVSRGSRSSPYHPTGLTRREALVNLLPALITEESATLLVLTWENFCILRPQPVISPLPTDPTTQDIRPSTSGVAKLLRAIRKLSACMSTIVRDPQEHVSREQRIYNDIKPTFRPHHSLHVKYPISPLPELEKWALVRSDDFKSTIFQLVIGAVPELDGHWHTILPSIHFPRLAELTISDDVRLDCSDFAAFVHRHPAIHYLNIGYNSIEITSLSTLPAGFLPKLSSLLGPAPIVNHILRSGEIFPEICLITVDPPPTDNHQWPTGYWQDPNDHTPTVQPHFSFAALNNVLEAVSQFSEGHDLRLVLTLPGGSESDQWLDLPHGEDSERVERRLDAVSILRLYTANDKPLSTNTLPLLERWILLFPRLGQVEWYVKALPEMDAQRRLELDDAIRKACRNWRPLGPRHVRYRSGLVPYPTEWLPV